MTSEWWITVAAALGAGFVSGAVTIALAEATALAAASMPSGTRIAVIIAFTVGHVAGKGLWYVVGTQERRITRPSLRRWIDRAHTLAAEHPTMSLGVTFTSAAISLPPFHLTAITAGIVRTPVVLFFAVAFVGRLLRFGLIAWAGAGVFGAHQAPPRVIVSRTAVSTLHGAPSTMPLPNPVVVVPGITASDLHDAYAVAPETVWSTLLNKNYDRILLHPDDLRYELQEPARVVPTAVFGTPYGAFIEELRHNLTEHRDKPVPVYPFPYDWRQPLDMIERQLEVFVDEVIARTKLMRHYHDAGYADAPAVTLVGHSMGGLIIAGYLQRLGMAAPVEKVATLGTPFRGSLEAPIKVVTGTASLGPELSSNSREREAARLTPALYHLLPSFRGSVATADGMPDDLYSVDTWQQGVVDTLAEFIRLHGLQKPGSLSDRRDTARQLLNDMLTHARAHRRRTERLDLAATRVGSAAGWLCLVGVDATTRVRLQITQKSGKPFFELTSEDRCNKWGETDPVAREDTGDGTVPFKGAVPSFIDRTQLVLLRPDDFGYWELKDKALLQFAGFHSLLPGLNLAHRLVVSHLRGKATKGVWARSAPGVEPADWDPPIRGLEWKA